MRTRLLLSLLLIPAVCAADPAILIRDAELKRSPASDAESVARLAAEARVETLERKGGWTRVKSAAGEGWVKMLSLRYEGPGSGKSGDSGLAQLFNVARTGSSGTQVTTGVRGLDAEQLAQAQPDKAELAKLGRFAAQPEAAAAFAAEGGLGAQVVAYPKP
ncbi:MAG TPA: hypothetical protein VF211_11005 [Burkholderiales bacterium]